LTASGEETEVAPVVGNRQPDVGICADGRIVKDFEGDKSVVFRLDDHGGHADLREKNLGGLGLVVVFGVAEAERWCRDVLVDIKDRFEG